MKLEVCGKGGCGKSTISALIAVNMKKMGYRVLVVDADESNFGLHRLLGIERPENILDQLGGKKGFREKMTILRETPQLNHSGLFNSRWTFDDIPEEYVSSSNDIKLMLAGKIHGFSEGCACPIGVLAKMILSNLDMKNKESVIIDTEAGTEHFGRGLEAECDMILVVVDPTYESFLLAEKIKGMAETAKRPVWFVLNKVTPDTEEIMLKNLDKEKVIGKIPMNDEIFHCSLAGTPLISELAGIQRICRFLLDTAPIKTETDSMQRIF